MNRPDDTADRRAQTHRRPHPPPQQPDPADPVDPDLLPGATARTVPGGGPARVIPAVAVGGVLGSLARYQAVLWWPPAAGRFDLTTALINVAGCLVIGVLATVISDLRDSHPLARPFWVTGVLGGFTTFSAYTVGAEQLLAGRHVLLAVLSLLITAVAAITGCAAARMLTLHLHHRLADPAHARADAPDTPGAPTARTTVDPAGEGRRA